MRLVSCIVGLAIALGSSFPAFAADVAEQDMTLSTPTGKIEGTLLLPAGAEKTPVVLIIAGSGPTDRDGNSALLPGKNNSLKMLAEALAQGGFASLRFDKRGYAASAAATTDKSLLRFENYVDDAAAWLKLLKADARFSNVAVLGHSQGSLIAILAAQKEPVRALVSVAGVAVNAADLLRLQLAGKLRPEIAQKNEEILTSLQAGNLVVDVPSELKIMYRQSIQPYLISWFHYTAEKEVQKLSCPMLVVQGDNDVQIDVAQALALQAAKPDARLLIVHQMNHVLKIVTGDRAKNLATYGDPSLPLPGELSESLLSFLHTNLQ